MSVRAKYHHIMTRFLTFGRFKILLKKAGTPDNAMAMHALDLKDETFRVGELKSAAHKRSGYSSACFSRVRIVFVRII